MQLCVVCDYGDKAVQIHARISQSAQPGWYGEIQKSETRPVWALCIKFKPNKLWFEIKHIFKILDISLQSNTHIYDIDVISIQKISCSNKHFCNQPEVVVSIEISNNFLAFLQFLTIQNCINLCTLHIEKLAIIPRILIRSTFFFNCIY